MTLKKARRGRTDNALLRLVQRFSTRAHSRLLRLSNGRWGGDLGGNPVLVPTTTGRRSGKPRDTPLIGTPDGPDWLFVASNGGSAGDPDWLLNIRANPSVSLAVGASSSRGVASELSTEERTLWWPRLVRHYRAYQSYQDKTDRQIAVVRVVPSSTENAPDREERP